MFDICKSEKYNEARHVKTQSLFINRILSTTYIPKRNKGKTLLFLYTPNTPTQDYFFKAHKFFVLFTTFLKNENTTQEILSERELRSSSSIPQGDIQIFISTKTKPAS